MRILVVRNDRMGDLLMSLPAVHELKVAFPKAEIFLLIREELKPLLEHHSDIDHILSWDALQGTGWLNTIRWGKSLRQFRFDTAVILNPTRFFHVATFLGGIPVRIGYSRKWGFLLTRRREDDKSRRLFHEAQYNLELLELLGIAAGKPHLSLSVHSTAIDEARKLLESCGINFLHRRLIGLHPLTSNPAKGWSASSFDKLASRLEETGFSVILIGETSNGLNPNPGMNRACRVANLVNRVPLRLLPALLKQCAVLVSNDSGPVHVAAAVGTPAIVVAPASHARHLTRWRPLGEKHQLLLDPTVEEVLAAVSEVTAHVSTSS